LPVVETLLETLSLMRPRCVVQFGFQKLRSRTALSLTRGNISDRWQRRLGSSIASSHSVVARSLNYNGTHRRDDPPPRLVDLPQTAGTLPLARLSSCHMAWLSRTLSVSKIPRASSAGERRRVTSVLHYIQQLTNDELTQIGTTDIQCVYKTGRELTSFRSKSYSHILYIYFTA